MSKHAKNSPSLQLLESSRSIPIEIPLPMLAALEGVENAFFELCVASGRQVLDAMMEQDREALCGPKWRRDPARQAGRGGSTRSEVTLGGRRLAVRRPRVRCREGEERELPSFSFAAARDPLDTRTLEAIASGVSTRKYRRILERLSPEASERSVSKSSVSRRFVALGQKQMAQWLSAPLDGIDVRIIMIDGIAFRDHTVLVALGIDTEGRKHVLGLREGSTENTRVAKALLRELMERGLAVERARLFVIDGAKALRVAIRKVFGPLGVIQRCVVHKRRNILEHLPEGMRPRVARVLTEAWDSHDPGLAKRRLERLASSLEAENPGAAASVREGLEETLTLQRLGVCGALYRTLRSTDPIENLNGSVAAYTRNVKRWRSGSMIVRWVSAALLEAERHFRRVRGYRDLPHLVCALEAIELEHGVTVETQVA
jgi:transposase-like protein